MFHIIDVHQGAKKMSAIKKDRHIRYFQLRNYLKWSGLVVRIPEVKNRNIHLVIESICTYHKLKINIRDYQFLIILSSYLQNCNHRGSLLYIVLSLHKKWWLYNIHFKENYISSVNFYVVMWHAAATMDTTSNTYQVVHLWVVQS